MTVIRQICAWFQCVDGATAIEYGLIAGGISLAIVSALFLFGADLQFFFDAILVPMDNAVARVDTTT